MSDGVRFEATFNVTGESEEHVTAFCVAHLRERGFDVAPANQEWEQMNEFCRRLKIHHMTFYRAMEQPDRPNVLVKRGATGRFVEILSNPAFDAFVTRRKKRRNRLSRPQKI